VYLGCKSMVRDAGIEAELNNSLRTLKTDYFDLYQLHELTSKDDVETVFSARGAMEVLLRAKESGLIRHIGLTAHSEDAAILALANYDFETVMFPINWALNMGKGFGDRLIAICKDRNLGLLGIKALAHRKLHDENENKREPKSWVKTIYNNDKFRLAAIKYAFSKGVDSIVPPGNFEQFSFAVDHIEECLTNPLTDNDRRLLEGELELIEGRHIFD